MDPQPKAPFPVAPPGAATAFSEVDYSTNVGKVIAHAATTGSAVVTGADGRPRVIISIPIVDLPTLDD